MLRFAGYAAWAAAAGALIPFMAVLNGRLGRALGEPLLAPVLLFAVGLMTALTVGLVATGQVPDLRQAMSARPIDFVGGVIVAGYVISVTLLAPRFGVGNAILFVMTAQIFTSALIDHFGLLGAALRPMTTTRLLGLGIVVTGLALSQLTLTHPTHAPATTRRPG